MEYIEFENILNSVKLNKKEFANIAKIPYQTVVGWNNTGKTPSWVEPFLDNYKKAKKFEKAKDMFCKMESENGEA